MHQNMREGNSLKPTKMCSLKNGLWLLRYAGRPTPKTINKMELKRATNVKINSTNQKGNAEREIPSITVPSPCTLSTNFLGRESRYQSMEASLVEDVESEEPLWGFLLHS